MKMSSWGKATLVAAAIAILTVGCNTGTEPSKPEKKDSGKHAHPDKGPHGGPLAEWGDEKYHAELVLEAGKKQATVYLFDGEVHIGKFNVEPIEAKTVTLTLKSENPPLQIELKADPQKGDPAGKASRFTGMHEKLGAKLDPEKIVASVVIKGTPYQGHFHVPGADDPPEDEFEVQPKP